MVAARLRVPDRYAYVGPVLREDAAVEHRITTRISPYSRRIADRNRYKFQKSFVACRVAAGPTLALCVPTPKSTLINVCAGALRRHEIRATMAAACSRSRLDRRATLGFFRIAHAQCVSSHWIPMLRRTARDLFILPFLRAVAFISRLMRVQPFSITCACP